ncbi:hypothetical protein MMC17_000732 [Xylographa soralifera]|nr:hypothetical protein [Xylographa soralifera]
MHTSNPQQNPQQQRSPAPFPALTDKTLTDQILALPSGRTLSYATYGSSTGSAFFYFQGLPGSRIEGAELYSAAVKLGIRIIAVDRSSLDFSSYGPDRLVADWAADVDQLARHLELKTYRVVGRSGDGAYALACVNALPQESLLGVGIVCGMGLWSIGTPGMARYTRVLWNIFAWAPSLMDRLIGIMVADLTQNPDPTLLMKKLIKHSGGYEGQDKAFMERKDIQKNLRAQHQGELVGGQRRGCGRDPTDYGAVGVRAEGCGV